jgi:hypothetical protein
VHHFKSDLVEEHSSSIYEHHAFKYDKVRNQGLNLRTYLYIFGLRGNGLGRDICSIPENVTQGVLSSIIKLENLTITGVIPSAFKGKLESPHPPLSKHKRIKFQKVKAWGKAFQIMWDMQVSPSGLWMLAGSGARLVTPG